MKPPLEVIHLTDQYLEVLRNEPQHLLTPGQRIHIYQEFGLSNHDKNSSFRFLETEKNDKLFKRSKADQVLGWLAILTAEKVFPIWEQAFKFKINDGEDWYNYPSQMLELARGVMLGMLDESFAYEKLVNEFYDVQVDSFCTEKVYSARSAAYSSLEVVLKGVEGLRYHPAYLTDDNISYSSRDFAAFAARSYCAIDLNEPGIWANSKGKLKPLQFDSQKRLEFWKWWLTGAIPQAWELAG